MDKKDGLQFYFSTVSWFTNLLIYQSPDLPLTQYSFGQITSFKDITILHFFDRTVLDSPQDPDLIALENRLTALAEETKQQCPPTHY